MELTLFSILFLLVQLCYITLKKFELSGLFFLSRVLIFAVNFVLEKLNALSLRKHFFSCKFNLPFVFSSHERIAFVSPLSR